LHINISLQIGLYAENEENFLFHINFIISRHQYGVWSCQAVTIFVQYKSSAICIHKIRSGAVWSRCNWPPATHSAWTVESLTGCYKWLWSIATWTNGTLPEINIWRHVEDTNKQCWVIRIRLRHQIKYKNVWQKFMHPCDWEVDR